MKTEITCAIYARYSSDLQRDTSIDDQVRKCRTFAEGQGWKILDAHIYADRGISGAITERKKWDELILAAKGKNKAFSRVVIDDTSRLARDLSFSLKAAAILKFNDVYVSFVSQGIDTESMSSRQSMTLHGMMDEQFLIGLADKVHRGQHGRVLNGMAAGGRCYGYRNRPIEDPVRLGKYGRPLVLGVQPEIDDAHAEVVRRIFTMYAEGNSLATIAKTLNKEGAPAPRASSNRKGSSWGNSSLHEMLRNERYRGVIVWNRTKKQRNPETGQKVTKSRPAAEWVKVEVPNLRIVSDELWQQAHARVDKMRDRYGAHTGLSRAAHSKYLFSGLMCCADCGAKMSIVTGCGKRGYAKYGCPNHRHRGTCNNGIMIRSERLENQLLDGIERLLSRPSVVDTAVKQVKTVLELRRKEVKVTCAPKESEANLKAQASRITQAIAVTGHSDALLEQLREIETKLREMRVQNSQRKDDAKPEVILKQVRQFVSNQLANLPELLRSNPARTKAFLAEHLKCISMAPTQADESPAWKVSGEWNLLPETVDAFAMVARDGFEPPTPAFSGLRSTN
jgi:site-specific DNA recombinase